MGKRLELLSRLLTYFTLVILRCWLRLRITVTILFVGSKPIPQLIGQIRKTNLYNLEKVDVSMAANLLTTNIKVRDFLDLKVNDVVPSEMKISEPVRVFVNHSFKFQARAGLSGKKRAIQITDFVEEDMEVEDNE